MGDTLANSAIMKLIKTYHWGESSEGLIPTDYYCPCCGEKSVYESEDDGDYHEGCEYVCVKCKFVFTMPSGAILKDAKITE